MSANKTTTDNAHSSQPARQRTGKLGVISNKAGYGYHLHKCGIYVLTARPCSGLGNIIHG